MCNIISSIIEEEIINSFQLFQAFDMHHRISYWIFHIKHKNQERCPSGDKEATQSGCYAHNFTKSYKKDREKHGSIEILIKKMSKIQIPAFGKKSCMLQSQKETLFWVKKNLNFWGMKGNGWRTLQRWAVWRSFLMNQRLQNSVQANKRAGERD